MILLSHEVRNISPHAFIKALIKQKDNRAKDIRRNDMPELKTRLKELRASRDMKQGDLAELVGVRRETIIRLEKGQYNPSLKLAMDIAAVFGVPVEEIFSFED
jgi:putative transcriptional regulator